MSVLVCVVLCFVSIELPHKKNKTKKKTFVCFIVYCQGRIEQNDSIGYKDVLI